MDLEWLGVGSIRMGFVIDGRNVYAHMFTQAKLRRTNCRTSPLV